MWSLVKGEAPTSSSAQGCFIPMTPSGVSGLGLMTYLRLEPSCGDATLSPFPDVKSSPGLHRPSDICCDGLHEEYIKFLT